MTVASQPSAERFRELILGRTGLAIPTVGDQDLERAFRRAAKEAGRADGAALLAGLAEDDGDCWDSLLAALNIGETHFFRDAEQIRELQTSILPALISLRTPQRRLRIWSAGCSSGEEPYTLAIILRELIPDVDAWDVLILATDINGASLARACRGRYRDWSLRGTPASGLGRWLQNRGACYEVAPEIRRMVTFERLNLVGRAAALARVGEMDLILCRNVLLYFDQSAARTVVATLAASLAERGHLMVSRVDAGLGIFEGLSTARPGSGVFTKQAPSATPESRSNPRSFAVRDDALATEGRIIPGRPRRARIERSGSRASGQRRISAPQAASVVPGSGSDAGTARPRLKSAVGAWRSAGGDRACEVVEAALADDPLNAALHYLHGVILLERGDFGGALNVFRRAIYADPRFALGYLGMGITLSRLGQRERARVSLETAGRLAAHLQPESVVLDGDTLTAGDVLELIAGERALLGSKKRSGR